MKMKKKICLAMSLLMLLMATPVSAQEHWNTRIDAHCTLPDIRVTVPSSGSIYINPLKMPVSIGASETNAQIVSTPAAIKNESEVPISVDVTVCGTPKTGSAISLSGVTTEGGTARTKKAFVYFEIQRANSAGPDGVAWDSAYDAAKHLVVRTVAKTKKNIVTLAADGQNGCYGAFRLTGDCVATPKVPWNDEDGLDVSVAFSFKAQPVT